MQVSELYQLTQWVKSEIIENQIIQKYSTLVNILKSNLRRAQNQPAKAFEEEKNDLLEAIVDIKINQLSLSQLNTLEKINIKPNIWIDGKEKIIELLNNTLDITHVAAQITQMQSELQQGIKYLQQLESALSPFIEEVEYEILPDHILTRVIFEHDASVENIEELKLWSSKWFDIGRGFAIANGQTPKDVQVIGGARGSLIIELALLATTALPIAKAINLILDSMIKYKDYQLKAFEVRELKKDTPKLAKDFEDDAKRWEKRATQLKKEIAEEVSEDIKQYFSNFKQDNIAEYNKAIKTLVDFLLKGGDVDCVISEDSEQTSEEMTETVRLLKQDFTEIRSLKETLFLEHKDKDKDKDKD